MNRTVVPVPGTVWGAARGDIYPEIYVQAYHDICQFVKSRDATARLAIVGLAEITPKRRQYLEKVADIPAALSDADAGGCLEGAQLHL
jgi:hypothetical protein